VKVVRPSVAPAGVAAQRGALGAPWREPVVQLLVVGAVLFGVTRAVGSAPAAEAAAPATASAASREPETRIVLGHAAREQVRSELAEELGGEPSPEVLQAALGHWVEDEVLFREGLRLGLDVDDSIVRDRVRAKMVDILVAKAMPAEPTLAELQDWFRAHKGRYDTPAQVDFVHVFVAAEGQASRARAERLLADIRGGADADGLGDTFSGGRTFRHRRLADVAEVFGDDFRAALERQPVESWQLVPSRLGWHVVRLDRHSAARAVELDEVRARVEDDVREARRREAVRSGIEALKRRYQEVPGP
jgi:hypothetical protein